MNTQQWLAKLIAFDTTSRHSNMALIEYVQSWFKQHGMHSRLTNDATEPKANLFGTLPAKDGSTTGGLVLSGHTDVVPVDGQAWDTNPFEAIEKDGKIYGRGACDMKGFLAVGLALLPTFKSLALPYPVHYALSYDEEVGCRGAPSMIYDLVHANIRPTACIVGEPTNMRPVIAHKGIQVFKVKLTGVAAHSSLTPKGCNAIEYAAQLICFIRQLATSLKNNPLDNLFDVPFTSVSANMIHGGIAHNIIPAQCEFEFEFRHLPQVEPRSIVEPIEKYIQQELLPAMRKENPAANIELINIAAAPSFESHHTSHIHQLSHQLCNEQDNHKVAYATEAGLFQRANIPTIVCGPGSIEQAHRANEFVAIEQLQQCEAFLLSLAQKFA
jgi:acetylornithine deacetylase